MNHYGPELIFLPIEIREIDLKKYSE
jgi:hypothetical protein